MLRSIASFVVATTLMLTAAPVVSASEHQPLAKRPVVSLKLNKTAFAAGDRIRIAGKVPTQVGVRRTLELQVRVFGGWEPVAAGQSTRKGAYSFALTAPRARTREVVAFRVKAQRISDTQFGKAATSRAARVVFRRTPSYAPVPPSLALPPACVTATPGVMAKTAACVAAFEVQSLERQWFDSGRLLRIFTDPSRSLQLGLDMGEEPTTPAEEYAAARWLAPYTSEVRPRDEFSEPGVATFVILELLLAHSDLMSIVGGLFGAEASMSRTWRAEWTRKLRLKDLSRVRMDGNRATLPAREFGGSNGAEAMTLTLGGTYVHRDGVWVAD